MRPFATGQLFIAMASRSAATTIARINKPNPPRRKTGTGSLCDASRPVTVIIAADYSLRLDRFFPGRFTLHKPCDPDAAFVKEAHRQTERDQGQDIRCRSDDGGEDENEDNGVGPGTSHKLVGNQPEPDEREHYNRQFERQSKAKDETGYKRIVLLHRPHRGPA